MVLCIETILLRRWSWLHDKLNIWAHLPKNQQGTSSTLLMLTSFLKLLSRLCQKRFNPGNHKRAIEICFCNRQVVLSDKKLPLISWCLSGCHTDLGKPSTLALTYSTNFQKQRTCSAKFICWVVLFLSLLGSWSSIYSEWKHRLIHCTNPSFSLGKQTFYPQALSQTKSGSLLRKSLIKNTGSYHKNGITVLCLPEFHVVWSSLKYTA